MKKNNLYRKHLPLLAAALGLITVCSGVLLLCRHQGAVPFPWQKNAWKAARVGLYEQYSPPAQWIPGRITQRRLAAVNQEAYPVFVRLAIRESCMVNQKLSSVQRLVTPEDAQEGWVPIPLDIKPYTAWRSVPPEEFTAPLPEGVSVKQGEMIQYGDNKLRPVYTIYRRLPGQRGSYQKLSADIREKDGRLTLSNLQYWYYDSFKAQSADWQGKLTVDEKTLRGSLRSQEALFIQLGAFALQPTENHWWHNEADGYVYWIGALPAGGTSALFAEGIGLDANAAAGLIGRFELRPTVEAVRARPRALRAENGWNLEENDPLYQLLAGFCEEA